MSQSLERKNQVIAQLKCVKYMADILSSITGDYISMFESGAMEGLIEVKGVQTAGQMESLGNMLNGMDAVTEDDAWMEPVFHKAHKLWPLNRDELP